MEKAHKLEHKKRKTCPPRGAARRGSCADSQFMGPVFLETG